MSGRCFVFLQIILEVSRVKQAAKLLMVAAMAAVVVSLCARNARAEFEAYHLYGAGPVSISLGGLSVGSQNDAFAYLVNPAYVKYIQSTRYSFAFGNYSSNSKSSLLNNYNTDDDYKYFILSYASGGKAYSLISDDQSGASRDMITYSTPVPGGSKYHIGVNISAFRFSSPPGLTQVQTIASDDGSGFSVDAGGFQLLNNGAHAALSIQNIISTASEISTTLGDRKVTLPRIFNLGIRYPLRDWIDIYGGYKLYTVDRGGAEGSSSNNLLYLGAEYRFRDRNISVRNGYQKDSEFTRINDDQYGQMGVSYVTDQYNAALGSLTYNDTLDSAINISVSYKPDEKAKWRESYIPEEEEPDTGALVDTIEKSVYEDKLPSTESDLKKPPAPEPVVAKPAPEPSRPDASGGSDIEYADNAASRTEGDSTVTEPVKETTIVADFKVDPKIIMIPQAPVTAFSDLKNHWSRNYVESIAKKGFFPFAENDLFKPEQTASRSEFYSLVFLSKVYARFADPIMVYFKTPYSVKAELWLLSPEIGRPIMLEDGTYERSGAKRLVVNRDLLDKAGVGSGKYKLRLKLQHEDLSPIEIEDYVTVLNTSMDFTRLMNLPPGEKMQQIDALKKNMSIIGLNVDFLDRLMMQGPVSRLEAILTLFKSAGAQLPVNQNLDGLFSDIEGLNTREKAAVYLASRGMAPLDGQPLMGGYPDKTFKPAKTINRAEAAALIARFELLGEDDLKPPYQKPYIPGREKPADKFAPFEKKPDTLLSRAPGNLIDDNQKLPEETKPTAKAQNEITISKEKPQKVAAADKPKFILAAGSYADEKNADKTVAILQDLGYSPSLYIEKIGSLKITHVVLGYYSKKSEAKKALAQLKLDLPDFENTMAVQPFVSGKTVADTPRTSKKPATGHEKSDRRITSENQSGEGEIVIEASPATVPEPLWNLMRNVDEYEPYTPESIRNVK